MTSMRWCSCLLTLWCVGSAFGQDARVSPDVAYKQDGGTEYERERCRFDLHLPSNQREFATLIWFHGGGLESGDKRDAIAQGVIKRFTAAGVAVASVNYRLSPKVTYPAYIDDAAAAVVAVRQRVKMQGGDESRVFVAGHSAGGYLTAMLAVAPQYLEKHGLQPSDFAGFIPISGQMITHSTVRKERGIPRTQPLIDAAAPAWHVGEKGANILCIWGDNDLPSRAEENIYFVAAMRAAGNDRIASLPVPERTHNTIASLISTERDVVAATIEKFIHKHRAGPAQQSKLRIEQTEKTLSVFEGDRLILVYNQQSPTAPVGIDSKYERSGFIHPVVSAAGKVVTAAFPADHPHQHGIFSAWVKTTFNGQSVDFWNLGGGAACVLHERLVTTFEKDNAVGFEVDLLHRIKSEPPVDVLRERWKVTVQPTDGSYRCFDIETKQQNITQEPLIIEKYHYGGVAVRGTTRWSLPNDSDKKKADLQITEPVHFLNSENHDRLEGNHAHARWVSMRGLLEGEPVSLTVLDHPKNYRAPQAARIHPTKPYFCFAPCVDGEFTIDASHPYQARYRFIIADTAADPAWLEKRWEEWAQR